MADILNQKEDVLRVEMTKHGRKMFGIGQFQPHYFSFFDNSVIYDSLYAGITDEPINSIQDRILYKSLTFSSLNNLEDTLKNKLGTSDTMNDYAPAWSLKVLNGSISYVEQESTYDDKIFDVDDIIYTINIVDGEPEVKGSYFLIDLQELNLVDDMSNFEIEIVTYDELSGGKTAGLERKLHFYERRTNIIDDIIYEESELPSKYFSVKPSPEDVSYYLDVLVDNEIDNEYIIGQEKTITEKIAGTYSTSTPPIIDKKC